MAICILGDQHDIDRAKHGGVDSMSADDLKKLNKNKKRMSTSPIPVFNQPCTDKPQSSRSLLASTPPSSPPTP